MGAATMTMPPSNFTQSGLARIFGIDLDESTKAPSNTAKKRTAIIAGTVCGVVGLLLLVALGGYTVGKWSKKHTPVDEPVYEKDVNPDHHGGAINEQVDSLSNSARNQ